MQQTLTFPDTLNSYLAQVKLFPILTEEEELRYSIQYRENNCIESAHKLVTSHLRYVVKIAYGYKEFGFPMLDLIQEGNIGLMRAVKKFDPYREARFAHYASFWVKNSIQQYILDNWSLVKIGTTELKRKLFHSLRSAKNKVYNLLGTEDKEAVAKRLKTTVDQIEEMEARLNEMCYDYVLEGSDESYIDSLEDHKPTAEHMMISIEQDTLFNDNIHSILESLNERERYIVEKRLSCDKENKLTFKEIAGILGISSERVRQLEENIIKKVRSLYETNR